MASGSTGRTGNDGYQGRGVPPDPDRPRPPVPRRPPPDGRPQPNGYREEYPGAPRPTRPQPPRDPQDPRRGPQDPRLDPQNLRRDPQDPRRDPRDPRDRRPGSEQQPVPGPRRDPRDPRDPGRDPRDRRPVGEPVPGGRREAWDRPIPDDRQPGRGSRRRRPEAEPDRDARPGPGGRPPREQWDRAEAAEQPYAGAGAAAGPGDPRRTVPRPRLPRGIDIIAGAGTSDEYGDGPDDEFADDELEGRRGSRRKDTGRRGRRRVDKLTPAQRRRRRIIRRSIVGVLALIVLVTGYSVEQALTAPGNSTTQARLAEWGRGHGLGWAVTWMENEQYKSDPPKTGGALSQSDLQQLQQPTATPSLAQGQKVLPPIKPFLTDPVAGEGDWTPAVVVNGIPIVQTAKLRSDPLHTSYLSGVAWISQKYTKFVMHPGNQEPGGSGWSEPSYITPAEMPGLVATWNGAFRLTNGDAKGGFYLDGKSYGTLVPGQATEVIMKDGTINVGNWNRDFTMGPNVSAVRQNLTLLVDGGQVNPAVDSSDKNLWGVTVDNKFYVWRSGVGITADGDVVYAMGPTLSVRTLAELLQRAGAVRAMELDINADWVSFMTYNAGAAGAPPVPTKLLAEFKHTGSRYYSTDERDFVAVYAR